MKDSCALSMIFIHERKGRTGHIFADSNTATDGLSQSRLSSAEFALERDGRGGPEPPPEVLTPRLQLMNREILNRGNRESGIGNRNRPWSLAFYPRGPRWPVACEVWPHLLARIAANASRRRGVASRFAFSSNTSSLSRAAASKSSSSAAVRISASSCRIISSSCAGL
jgi:hypothetical protein